MCIIKQEIDTPSFAWLEGYAAFMVSGTAQESVRSCLVQHDEHPRVKNAIAMLDKAGIECDLKYLDWHTLRPLQGRRINEHTTPGRSARPGANSLHPFGMKVAMAKRMTMVRINGASRALPV